MFELDKASGTITCDNYILSRDLKYSAFRELYPEFYLTQTRYFKPRLIEKTFGSVFKLSSDQLGYLSVSYLNQDIDRIHIDVGVPDNFNWERDMAEVEWWKLQQQWIPFIRPLVHSQLGVPNTIERTQLFDESKFLSESDLTQLKQLEDWTYRFSWGKAGLSYVSEDYSYRFWVGYKSSSDL